MSHVKTDSDSVRVCVRVRPLTEAESKESVLCTGSPSDGVLQLVAPSEQLRGGQQAAAVFQFDWVLSGNQSQEDVYDTIGHRIVEGVAEGFHGCVFAYGQTGSGKSHTIFGGPGDSRGLLPRIGEGLLEELWETECITKLSYFEIYNEKLRDLLCPDAAERGDGVGLAVRQHPTCGVFVEGLTCSVVHTAEDVSRLLDFGHKIRVVGSTNVNAASSRSHVIATLHVERHVAHEDGRKATRRARLHAVDLAGSERMKDVEGGSEARLKESRNVNKSLWALSLMISRLSSQEPMSPTHVPYRNSKLTHILSDSLMGSCRTVMIACISPAADTFSMTESTVRFACSAKAIRTRAVLNEELDADLIGGLRAEIESLRQQLNLDTSSSAGSDRPNLKRTEIFEMIETAQLLQDQRLASWADVEAQSSALEIKRRDMLMRLGVSTDAVAEAWKSGRSLVLRPDADPYLVNVCEDPLLSGCLTYTLSAKQRVQVGSDPACFIHINGLGIQSVSCTLMNLNGRVVEVTVACGETDGEAGTAKPLDESDAIHSDVLCDTSTFGESDSDIVDASPRSCRSPTSDAARLMRVRCQFGSLFKSGVSQVYVNNEHVLHRRSLHDGDRLRIGHAHVFHLRVPQAQEGGPQRKSSLANIHASINEFTKDDSNEQLLAKEYGAHLKERVGRDRAEGVFEQLTQLLPLVEEANELTDELRGDHANGLLFKAHVLTDVTSANEDPAVVVVLRVSEKLGTVAGGKNCLLPSSHSLSAVRCIWNADRFKQRLDVLRDLYAEVSERDLPWGEPRDPDPWREEASVPLVADGGPTVSGITTSGTPALLKMTGSTLKGAGGPAKASVPTAAGQASLGTVCGLGDQEPDAEPPDSDSQSLHCRSAMGSQDLAAAREALEQYRREGEQSRAEHRIQQDILHARIAELSEQVAEHQGQQAAQHAAREQLAQQQKIADQQLAHQRELAQQEIMQQTLVQQQVLAQQQLAQQHLNQLAHQLSLQYQQSHLHQEDQQRQRQHQQQCGQGQGHWQGRRGQGQFEHKQDTQPSDERRHKQDFQELEGERAQQEQREQQEQRQHEPHETLHATTELELQRSVLECPSVAAEESSGLNKLFENTAHLPGALTNSLPPPSRTLSRLWAHQPETRTVSVGGVSVLPPQPSPRESPNSLHRTVRQLSPSASSMTFCVASNAGLQPSSSPRPARLPASSGSPALKARAARGSLTARLASNSTAGATSPLLQTFWAASPSVALPHAHAAVTSSSMGSPSVAVNRQGSCTAHPLPAFSFGSAAIGSSSSFGAPQNCGSPVRVVSPLQHNGNTFTPLPFVAAAPSAVTCDSSPWTCSLPEHAGGVPVSGLGSCESSCVLPQDDLRTGEPDLDGFTREKLRDELHRLRQELSELSLLFSELPSSVGAVGVEHHPGRPQIGPLDSSLA